MKTFTCNTFEGHWPLGTAAVVAGGSLEEAWKILHESLIKRGLKGLTQEDELIEMKPDTQYKAIILLDGDY